jgi:hypothetical protein
MGIRDEVLKIEIAEGLNRALDKNFQRVRENASREWENRFAGWDPSDACVSVRIHAARRARLSTLPTAGFVAGKAQPQTTTMRPLLV